MDHSLEHRKPFARQNSDGTYQKSMLPQASFSGSDGPGSYEYFNSPDEDGMSHFHDDDDTTALVGHRKSPGESFSGMPLTDSPYGDIPQAVSPVSAYDPDRKPSVPNVSANSTLRKDTANSGLGIITPATTNAPPVAWPQTARQFPSISIDTALSQSSLPSNSFIQSTSYNRNIAQDLPLAHPEYVVSSPTSPKRAPSFKVAKPSRNISTLKQSFQKGSYARIEEEDEDAADLANNKVPMSPTEPIGFDVSSMGGFTPMDNIPLSALPRGVSRKGHRYTPSAEENILEQKGLLTGGLGRGMGTVRGLKLNRKTTKRGGATDAAPLSPVQDYSLFSEDFAPSREIGQEMANKSGQIIAIEEAVDFDITNADGGMITPSMSKGQDGVDGQGNVVTKMSYFYPTTPQPDWKPLVMRWWYITFVTLTALTLAGVQEYLVQRSHQLESTKGGLLRFISAKDVSLIDYFAWKYLPTMVLLTYGVMWQITDYEVKRLEPYFQLARKEGSEAERSLSLDYLTCFAIVAPFKALYNKHWAVLYSSTATLVSSSLVPILQSPSLEMFPAPEDRKVDEFKFVRVDPVWSRLTEGFLLIPALAGILLFIQLRRRSGLKFDPKGIAGLAAMANRSHILVDFQGLDVATPTKIHRQLKRRRYILHNSCIWQGEYIKNPEQPSTEDEAGVVKNPHPFVFRLIFGIPYMSSLLLFMVLIPVFMFTPANIATQRAPWLLTTLATGLKVVWSNLDGNCRLLEPFYILSRRHAPPKALTLDYTGTAFGWIVIKAFMNKHFLAAAVSFGSVLCEILVVCVSSFDVDGKKFLAGHGMADGSDPSRFLFARFPQDPKNIDYGEENARYNSSETFRSFWTSFGLSLGILAFLIIVASLVYLRRSHAFLPREPNSIASVLAYIHQSRMLYDFTSADDEEVQVEDLDNAAMTKFLEQKGKTYGMGWFRGRDGQGHMGIDEEELSASYTHGKDWKSGMIHSVGSWDRY